MKRPHDPASALRTIGVLAELGDDALGALAAEVEWRAYRARETIVRHLDPAGDVYFILDGVCRAQMRTPHGRMLPIRELKAGDYFGELAALTGAPRSLTVEALSETSLAACPQARFLHLMQTNAPFAGAIAAHLARSVVSLTDRVYEFATLEMRFRLYAELMRLARQGRESPEGLLIEEAPTHEALAAAIGSQREHVTRELRQLAQDGVLRQARRTLVICDMVKLEDMVRRRAGLTASQVADWRS